MNLLVCVNEDVKRAGAVQQRKESHTRRYLPKRISLPVLRVPDPVARVKKIPGSRIRISIKEFKYLNTKKLFKALGIMIQNIHPGSGSATLKSTNAVNRSIHG